MTKSGGVSVIAFSDFGFVSDFVLRISGFPEGAAMPILIQCTSCLRKLRVQDHLLGKTVKCPSCGVKFVAQPSAEGPAAEETMRTPVVPPSSPDAAAALVVETLEIT